MIILLKFVAGLVITITLAVGTVNAAKYLETKPDVLNPCQLLDPDFNKCYAKNFQGLIHEWKDGIPGYKAFGSLDPLHVKRVVITQDPKNPVAFNADLRNVVLTGVSKAVGKGARFDAKSLKLQLKLFMPKLSFDCDYKLNGSILKLALNGNGKGFFEIENFSILLKFQLKLRDEYGYTFTDVEKLSLDVIDIGGFHVHFDNLFSGQKALEDSTNALFNENWRDFYEILHPAISKAVEAGMYDRLSKAFSYVPANYFIEDIPSAANHKS